MNSKSLLIAIAALALTATGAQAFNGQILARANLTESQRAAFEVARELQAEGDTQAAKEILIEAGIDEEVIERLREAVARHGAHRAIHTAVEAGDYGAFMSAIADLPLSDIITTEADFYRFKEAHDLKLAGEVKEAKEIFGELGLPEHDNRGEGRRHGWGQVLQDLSVEQQEAFAVAKQSNNQVAMKAVLIDAGAIEEEVAWTLPKLGRGHQY